MFWALMWFFACATEPVDTPPDTIAVWLKSNPPKDGEEICVRILFKRDPGNVKGEGITISKQKPGGVYEGVVRKVTREKLYSIGRRPDVHIIRPCTEEMNDYNID